MENGRQIVCPDKRALPKVLNGVQISSVKSDEEDRSPLNTATATKEATHIDEWHDSLKYFGLATEPIAGDTASSDSSFWQDNDIKVILERICRHKGPWIDLEYDEVIDEANLISLLERLRVNHYSANGNSDDDIYSKCKSLFEKDYRCEVVDNYGGTLSKHYPIRLIIPVEKLEEKDECSWFDPVKYHEQIKLSSQSRCRTRFVVPVILLKNKFICRSATLSVLKGAVFETVMKPEEPKDQVIEESYLYRTIQMVRNLTGNIWHRARSVLGGLSHLVDSSSMEKLRDIDNQVLKNLKIRHICDLMTEDRKMFIQSIVISSSEKINRDIYRDFALDQLPYPGCEFFKLYHAAGRRPEDLYFDWNMSDVNTELHITKEPSTFLPDIPWENYKIWDIIELTQAYLILILHFLIQDGGVLIHCVSGWDRTPLFISLLRITLWADGVIHENLDFKEMAYLTLAYDWYLFGHNLPARLVAKEEIMHFCFNFLPYIKEDSFSITRLWEELPDELKGNKQFAEFVPNYRFQRIDDISKLVLRLYEKCVINVN